MHPLVVIPTFNERSNLPAVLNRTLALPDISVLIVDDSSTDGTGEVADQAAAASGGRVSVLHRPSKLGLGSAYRDGFAWGLEQGYDVLCEMDADLSHDPADLPRLLEALADSEIAIGSRYVPGGCTVGWPWHRMALSRGGNVYVRALTGCKVKDATGGFRAYRAKVIDSLNLHAAVESEGYAFQIEMLLRSWQAGFRVAEVPITFTERVDGDSKMSSRIVWEAVRQVPVWARELRSHRRAVPVMPPEAPAL